LPSLENLENEEEDELTSDNNEEKEKIKNDLPSPRQLEAEKNKAELTEFEKATCQKINDLLKKFGLENKDLSEKYQNYVEQISALNSQESIAAFAQEIEKEIRQKSQMLNKVNNIPVTAAAADKEKNKSLLFLGLGLLIVSLGGTIAWFIFFGKNLRKNKGSNN